jgi:hypothetical protein
VRLVAAATEQRQEVPMADALVFDIETVADLTPENRDDVAALGKGREMTAEQYGGLCPPLARVVCIAWLDLSVRRLGVFFDRSWCAGDLPGATAVGDKAVTCELTSCAGEIGVLEQFGRFVEERCGNGGVQLVTYNGRGFDLPVLVHRALRYKMAAGRELFTKAIQENRYRPGLHLDLLDAVTFYGASGRWPMAAYAMGYGFKSPKSDMSGADVWDAVQAGRILDVARYCAGDVLAAAHIYETLQAIGRPPGE